MSVFSATRQTVENAILGGCVLGGGGGGAISDGRRLAMEALRLGGVQIASVDDLDRDAMVVTAAAVGAPSTVSHKGVSLRMYADSIRRFSSYYGATPAGVISCENGGLASVNGWIQAAVAGIVVVDAPANGRAHPIGLMGSMGLEEVDGYESHQVIIAGNDGESSVEAYIRGPLGPTTDSVRAVASTVPGLAANIRNPVSVEYLRKNAAVGALSQAIGVGHAMNTAGPLGMSRITAAADVLGGRIVTTGVVERSQIWVKGGYDYGRLTIQDDSGDRWYLPLWNEYLGAETQGKYSATFPDLIMTFDLSSGDPLPSSAMTEGLRIAVLVVPQCQLILGSGCLPVKVTAQVERALSEIALLAATDSRDGMSDA